MPTAQFLAAALSGLGLGLSLIVAIGAQNAFVLRQGIRRRHVALIVAICIASDVVLIAVGIGGGGAVFDRLPWLVVVARWVGGAFLVGYGLLAARRAWRPRALRVGDEEADAVSGAESPATLELATVGLERGVPITTREDDAPRDEPSPALDGARVRRSGPPRRDGALAAALTVLALTWLNPHVYIDTVVLLGSIANTHGEARWAFGVGAIVGSILWFTGLGLAARALAPVFAKPGAWRILDAVIAVVMIGLGVSLVIGA